MKPPAPNAGALPAADTPLLQASPRPPGSRQFKPRSGFSPVGIVVMVAAHGLLGYALVSSMAGKTIQTLKKPLDVTIIAEVTPPLPPPPPPPQPQPQPPRIKKIESAPKVAVPPPAYVPPPDLARAAPAAPEIAAVQTTQAVAPPPAAPPSPPAVPPVAAAPARAEMALVCPKQIKPEVPRRAIEDGVEGTVKAEVRVRGGKVVDVRIVSGPRAYHAAVRTALARYECDASSDQEFVVTQDFTFKLE